MNAASADFLRHTRLVGLTAVALLTFSAPYVLEALGLDVLRLMFFSPIFVLPACIGFFLFESRLRAPSFLKGTAKVFAQALMLWALAGAGMALVGVIAWTAATDSPQGPLALIIYGPAGIAIGGAVGTAIWRLTTVKPNLPLQDRPAASGRPLS
jgi:hypothetical protein